MTNNNIQVTYASKERDHFGSSKSRDKTPVTAKILLGKTQPLDNIVSLSNECKSKPHVAPTLTH
jgi:hypothetical protein